MNTEFIAEIGSNHNGSLQRALRLIEKAAEIGCHGAKFQMGISGAFATGYERSGDLPEEWLPQLKECCRNNGIEFGCTPLSLDAVSSLRRYVDFWKVASYDIGWGDLFREFQCSNARLYVSVGMALYREIDLALEYIASAPPWGGLLFYDAVIERTLSENDVTLLHCISSYPAQYGRGVIGGGIRRLERFRLPVGYSDHTKKEEAIREAIFAGAVTIEFHFDLDGHGGEYLQSAHCWLPDEIGPVIDTMNPDWRERRWRRDDDGFRPMKWTRR